MKAAHMKSGNYSYVPGVMQYSAGVGADAGYELERVRFEKPVPLSEGFDLIEKHLKSIDRPLTAFCACELRSPGQFSEEGFRAFNTEYADVLRKWGIMDGDDNPVARSNVCPEIHAPSTPSFYAFAYTVPTLHSGKTFAIAGSGEAPEGHADYASVTVSPGDTSEAGLRQKAQYVVGEMQRRMGFFDAGWKDVTSTQLYTVYDVYPLLADEIVSKGAAEHGLTWHFDRPPIVGLDFEMDCRRIFREHVLVV